MASLTMNPFASELIATAKALAAPGKGILASDESVGTIGKRFSAISLENTEENRRKYRELLYTAEGLGKYISGAIMFEETLFHKSTDGTPFPSVLQKLGIISGIKVDKGVKPIFGTDNETSTQGLDDLGDRCDRYYAAGARFAKWRGVIHIKESGAPSDLAIQENVTRLARYASICQSHGLVPIVEPEVLMDGPHTIERAAEVTHKVLVAQYKALADHHVLLEGTLLKPNMVRAGTTSSVTSSEDDIARATVRVMQHTVPVAVPGIMFLSGGMSEEQATVVLNKMNQIETSRPWSLSFSYGRALQQTVLQVWQGKSENEAKAKEALLVRAKANSEAQLGVYKGSAGVNSAATESLHVENYSY